MQTTSALYNQIMADINRRFEVKLVIDGVEYGTDAIFSAKTESRIFDSKPTIGGCYCATLDFTILSDGTNIPRMASVVPYFRVVNDTQQSEWIQHGLFYIDHRKVTNNGDNLNVFTAECFDAMLKANAAYSASSLNWPATDTQVVAEIAAAIGVAVDPRTTAMLTKGFTIPAVPVEYTYRDILSFIGVVYAGNWIISDEGKLRLVPIGGNSDTLNIGKELMSMNVSPKRNGYTKVVITTSDGEAIESGSSDDMVMDAYCPYATQAIADDILTALSTYQYEPFDASGVWSDPAVEVGDKVTAVEKTVVSYARTVNYGPGMVMNLSAPDDGFIDHEYSYESPSERRYTRTMGDLKAEITLNENKIALVVSETAGGLVVNSASIVAAINDSGSSVIINADKIDLEGYVTLTNLETAGETIINGGNLTTGIIQDATRKNYWNLETGELEITEGTIRISTTDDQYNYITLSGRDSSVDLSAAGTSVKASDHSAGSLLSFNDLSFLWYQNVGSGLYVGHITSQIKRQSSYIDMVIQSSIQFTQGSFIRLYSFGSFGFVYVNLEVSQGDPYAMNLAYLPTGVFGYNPLYQIQHSVSWKGKTCILNIINTGQVFISQGNVFETGDKIVSCFPIFYNLDFAQ